MNGLIIGYGEVGSAHAKILQSRYVTYAVDTQVDVPERLRPYKDFVPEILHICFRYSKDFVALVHEYSAKYNPKYINVCTTCPPGTTQQLGALAVHSTTRGLHPNLVEGLKTIPKHVGGPESELVAKYFREAGIKCVTHPNATTTEVAHLCNNIAYGVNLMLADDLAQVCRHYGVDYYEAVMRYTQSNNEGFDKLGHRSKCRMILTPPQQRIGGHCVKQSAQLVPAEVRTPTIDRLANYGA